MDKVSRTIGIQSANPAPVNKVSMPSETVATQNKVRVPGETVATAYQQNLAKPIQVEQTSNQSAYRQAVGRIYDISQGNPLLGRQLQNEMRMSSDNPASPFYRPYSMPTNQAVNELAKYNINAMQMTADWFSKNTDWQNYLVYNGTTNTPSNITNSKKATDAQKISYWIYQIYKSEEDTENAELEWEALKEEVSYKAKNPNRNDSDDEIVAGIDWKKYPTLARMQATSGINPIELNRAVDFSIDDLYGVMWNARNGQDDGDIYSGIARSVLGEGNVWKEDPELRAKLDWNNPDTYSPYSAGMTLDQEVGMYFGLTSFDQETIDILRQQIDPNDETSRKMFEKVQKAWDNTVKAETEKDELDKKINNWISNGKSEEFIVKQLDKLLASSQFSTLKAMDDSIINGSDLIETTRAINYKKSELLQSIHDRFVEKDEQPSAADIKQNGLNGPTGQVQSVRAARELDQYTRDTATVFEDDQTPQETAVFSGYSGSEEEAKAELTEIKAELQNPTGAEVKAPDINAIAQKQTSAITKGYIEQTAGVFTGITEFENQQAILANAQQVAEDLKKALGVKVYAGQTNEPTFDINIDGNTYRVNMFPDMSGVWSIDQVTNAGTRPVYASFGIYDTPDSYDEDTLVWQKILESDELAAFEESYKLKGKYISEANAMEITEDDEQMMKALRQAEMQIEDAEKYISENQDQYDKDVAAYLNGLQRLEVQGKILKWAGADTFDIYTANAVMQEIAGFSSYEATVWDKYNPTYAYTQRIESGEDREAVLKDAEAEHNECVEQIKDIEWTQQYLEEHGIKIPDEYKSNMERRLNKLNRDLQDYEFFKVQWSDDFKAVADAERLAEYENRPKKSLLGISTPFDGMTEEEYFASTASGQYEASDYANGSLVKVTEGLSELMTQDEQDTWYYLKAQDEKDGTHRADDYINFMFDPTYGVVWVRKREQTEQMAEDLTSSGAAGFAAANIASVLLSPYNAIASAGMLAFNAITGNEFNPNNPMMTYSFFRNKTREQSAVEIANTAKKWANGNADVENILQQIMQGGYEIVTNRADSAMNAATFGWMFGGVGSEAIQEFLGAAPMGMSAAMDAAARAKERGASDTQAYAIAACTFAAETLTEAISLDNMKKAFKIGEDVTGDTFKAFLKNWLTSAGISEMLGESANDVVENIADEKIMGILSEHAALVEKYRLENPNISAEDAEAMARRDELNGVLHTALISYLSPGLDVFQTVGGKLQARQNRTIQFEGQQQNESAVRNIRKGNTEQAATSETTETNVPVETATTQQTEEELQAKQNADNFTIDFEILETAKDGDQSAQNAAISAVLDEEGTAESGDQSSATAANLHDMLGENRNAAEEVQDLLIGANVTNAEIPPAVIKQGLKYAALGGESSACRQVMQSDEYQKATPAVKASMLAGAVQEDQRNAAIDGIMPQNVHEFRVARAEAKLISQGAAEAAAQAEVKIDLAELETAKAQDALKTQQDVEQAAREDVTAASVALTQDPGNIANKNWLTRALNTLQNAGKVTQEYMQSLKNAQQREKAAREESKNVKQRVLADIRQQAEATINQEDAARAEAAEQQRIADEQAAQEAAVQQAAQQEADNAYTADVDEFIESEFSDYTPEQQQHVREVIQNQKQEFQEAAAIAAQAGEISATEILNRQKFMNRISKKFGVNIDLADTTEGGTTFFKNGFYDRDTNTITIDNQTSVNDLMYKVIGHELTHVAETSGTYTELANALLQIKYGADVDYADIVKRMDSGDVTGQLIADALERKSQYEGQLGKQLSNEYALQEIVADEMGELLNGNQELIDRLAAEKPSLLRRIIDSIKGFIKKAKGMDGEWMTSAQRTVDLLENSLNEAQKKNASTKYSLNVVPAVQSSDESVWQPGHTESWFRENGFPIYQDVPLDQQEINRNTSKKGHGTQIASTESTYRKLFERLQKEYPETWQNMRVLDASSGLGLGTKAGRDMGFQVTDIEPFPSDTYKPDYTDYIELQRQVESGEIEPFDFIISNAVLNVIPQDTRDNLVAAMGSLVKPGGSIFVNVISKDYEGATKSNPDLKESLSTKKGSARTMEGDYSKSGNANGRGHETFVWGSNSVQKVFSTPELIGYLKDALGDDFNVKRDNIGMTGVLVTKKEDSTKYSLPTDDQYMKAVENNDMETAQQMVDEKAEEEGYTVRGEHGTVSKYFTVFDRGYGNIEGDWGRGFYFTSNSDDVQQNYATEEGGDITAKIDRLAEELEWNDEYADMDYDERREEARKMLAGGEPRVIKAALRIENPVEIGGKNETFFDYTQEYDEENDEYGEPEGKFVELMEALQDVLSDYEDARDVDLDKLWTEGMDYEGLRASDFEKLAKEAVGYVEDYDVGGIAGNEIVREAFERAGYDGIVDHTVAWKFGNRSGRMNGGMVGVTPETTHYIVFHPEQIKQTDAVTYDNNGNVIPLSQRFNRNNNDIRYSLPSDNLIEQKFRYYMQNGGSMGQQQGPQRQFGSKTAQKSDVLNKQTLDYLKEHSSYTPDTNAAELARAIEWIGKNTSKDDPDGYQRSLQKVTSKTFNYRTKDGQARTIAVMGMAVAKNDVNAQVMIADAYNKEGTSLGQALQARKLFRLMTPEGRIAAMRKMLSNAQDEINRKGSNIELAFSNWIYQAAANATEEGDFQKVKDAAAQELAQQIPANWKDRIRSLRMLSMLANPRTHIRNIIGNLMFEPAVGMKNKLGALMELGTKKGNKTKTLALVLPSDIKAFATQDATHIKDILTGEAKYHEANIIKKAQTKLGRGLDWLSEKNSNALEKEDWFFLKGHYRRALGGWMLANGYTVDQMNSNAELLEKGRAYAIEEAQKATYRDFNKTASILNNVSRQGGVSGFIVDAVLPFKKTPANILRRGIEYSPAGIVKALTADMYHLKQYNDFMNGKLNTMPEKAISPSQFIDHLCSGLSGTAIMALGYFLAGTGAVSCGLDDDEDKFDKAKGLQEYAVKFKLFGQDVSFTMDWAAPMSMPFFVGTAIREMDTTGDYDADKVINAFGNITEPVFNLSMLDGINTVFKTSQYDDTNTLTQIGAKVATNYVTSYIPSVLGAIARTIDDKQRKSFVEQGKGTGVMGTIRYAVEQVQNKIPGWNRENIPVRDIWGEEKTSSLAERILENFILPGYVNEYKEDPVINEMARLFDSTGDAAMIPKEDPDKSITANKVKHVLTDKQWDLYKETRNKTAHKELTELMNSPEYKKATDATQVQMIKDIWSHADKVGKNAVIPEVEVDNKSVETIAKDSKVTSLKNELVKALNAEDYDAYDSMVEAIREEYDDESDADSVIKTKIGNEYRDRWKEAYRKGDYATMADIEMILDYTGFDFNIYGRNGWQEKEDEKVNN